MNLTKLDKINEAADAYADAKMALDRLPPDAEVIAYLKDNPEDMRLAVRTPPSAETLQEAIDENPEIPEEVVRHHLTAQISVDVSADDWGKMLTYMRAALQDRVERLANDLRELGVDPDSAEAAAAEAESANGQRLH